MLCCYLLPTLDSVRYTLYLVIVGLSFAILSGNGGAETCDGAIFNATIVNDNGDVVGTIQNFIIIFNGSEVPGGMVMDDVVFFDNATILGNATNVNRTQVKCDCKYFNMFVCCCVSSPW